jgi:ABC-type multidrug transport system fused ATPase/permease subunit
VIGRVIANESPPLNISLNSHSIYSLPLAEYRKDCVNLFPQDSYLFSGTVRDVVDPHHHYAPEVILTQLRRFSQVVVSEDVTDGVDPLSSLVNLNSHITANGGNISAGEKQILTLVRASLSEARIIILDEITSNMSIPAAAIAIKMLRSVLPPRLADTHRSDLVEKKEAGIILICHRPDDMTLCDEVSSSRPPLFPHSRLVWQLWEVSGGQLLSRRR